MESLLAANPIDIPQTLKHQEAHSLQHDAMRRMGIEDHDKAPPIDTFSEAAEKRVRLGLLLRQVIADNDLKVDAVTAARARRGNVCRATRMPPRWLKCT